LDFGIYEIILTVAYQLKAINYGLKTISTMNRILTLLVLTLFFAGCSGTKNVTDTLIVADTEFRQLDTMTVSAPLVTEQEKYERPDYQPTYHRKNDLIHTALDLRFDWTKQHVLGQATLDFKPYFYPMDKLVLDAKGFDIHKVAMVSGGQKRDLKYDYDNLQLAINLGRTYQPNEEYSIFIDYTAKPNELEETVPSEAIQDLDARRNRIQLLLVPDYRQAQ